MSNEPRKHTEEHRELRDGVAGDRFAGDVRVMP